MGLITASFLAVLMAVAVHESGHWLCARSFGEKLNFSLGWGMIGEIPVPRGLWTMPDIEQWKQRMIASAGFVAEIAVGLVLLLEGTQPLAYVYMSFVFIHAALYKFYSGEDSDIKWMLGTRKEL